MPRTQSARSLSCTARAVAALAALVALGESGKAQIVLRDQPRRTGGSEAPRWLGSTPARGDGERRLFIDRALNRIEGSQVVFDPDAVRFRDQSGRPASLAMREVIAILPVSTAPVGSTTKIEWREIADVSTGPTGRVELVDGQVIPGRLVPGVRADDAIAWQHPVLGKLSVSLDNVSLIVLRPGDAKPIESGQAPTDVVQFSNGDVARGVVEEISVESAPGLLRMESSGKAFTSGLDRVSAIALANDSKAPVGARIWLRDGAVIGAASCETRQSSLRLSGLNIGRGEDTTLDLAWEDVVAINLDSAKVRPLALVPLVAARPAEGRDWVRSPEVGSTASAPIAAADIDLFGPVEAEWALPARAVRVSFSASLPSAARAYGDCWINVECGAVHQRERLNADRPVREFVLALAPSDRSMPLKVRIESGEGGPIQDHVVLGRALVLVE